MNKAILELVLCSIVAFGPVSHRSHGGYGHGYADGWRPQWQQQWRHHHSDVILRQGYETYSGGSGPSQLETICVPAKEAMPDQYTYVHPKVGPGYLCRDIWR